MSVFENLVTREPICRLPDPFETAPWALGFGEEEIRIAKENAALVLGWYDDLKEIVPNWYRK